MEEIRNKVQESGLISMDLADFKPDASLILSLDIADQLWQGLVLKEKDFRDFIATHEWSLYKSKFVFIHCSADAIVPTWAYMLVASKLLGVAKMALVGSRDDLEKQIVGGDILVVHDNPKFTLRQKELLPNLIAVIRKKGLSFGSIPN
jgi:hypothetical protein